MSAREAKPARAHPHPPTDPHGHSHTKTLLSHACCSRVASFASCRYKEAVLDGTALTLATAGGGSDDAEMRKPSKAAVIKALKHPVQLEHLRNAASAQGMVESVDFCCEVQEYKLLFAAADRKPRAETMYKTYVMAGADLPINIPDSQTQKIEKNYEKHEPELFDDAYQELLQVISDNIFDRYIQELDRHSKVETKRPASPLAKAAESGGCCVLM